MKINIIHIIIFIALLLSSYVQAQDDDDYYYDDNNNSSISFDVTLNKVRTIVKNDSDFSSAEARSSIEIDKSLRRFLDTPLMDKFLELKLEAESLIITFKTRQQDFTTEQILTVKNSYEIFSEDYNKMLLQIKVDFMNRKQRKAISKNPNWYAATLELQFRNLHDSYSQNLLQEVANLTGSDQYSAFPLMAILGMIDLVRDFANHLTRINYEGKKIREQHLMQFFIEPYSMKKWDFMQGINNYNHNSYDDPNTYNSTEGQSNESYNPYENRNPFGETQDTTSNPKKKQ